MKEAFLQFIWQQQLIKKYNLLTVCGQSIEILSPGQRNTDAGPDFINAKIRIADKIWAGTVEIHVKSSDWEKHKHSADRAYDNVILHVVYDYDADIQRTNGEIIPTFVLKIDDRLYKNYMRLIKNKGPIACADFLKEIDKYYIKILQNSLVVERLKRKSNEVLEQLKQNNNSWEETFYVFLAKSFGFKQNAVAFEMLAKSLPLRAIAKQKDDLQQVEAMLFGQAGFLSLDCQDDYFRLLQREYIYLQKKYNLKPLERHLWKFLRMRPTNFPTIRIAQFAAVLHKNSNLFSKILEAKNVELIKKMFEVETSEYWTTHFTFGKEAKKSPRKLGKSSIDVILINILSLFLFSYGLEKNDEDMKLKALDLLESIKPEKNNIIEKWNRVGVFAQNAFESQALIELFNEYCQKERCVDCSIGTKIIISENY